MSRPAIIEATRGPLVESRHAVDLVVADAEGVVAVARGEAETMVYPRSAVKAFQALPLIESGAADAFGLSGTHLALACASHNAEPAHVQGVSEMLRLAGLGPEHLECGPQPPNRWPDQAALRDAGAAPGPIHNPCSGKHAGMAATAAHLGAPIAGYAGLAHPVQRAVAAALTEMIGAPHAAANHGIDGCSLPTYAVPLDKLAIAFARFGAARPPVAGAAGDAVRVEAVRRLFDACVRHPEMVAGTNRACTGVMQALGARAFVKTGAEGVFVAALPEKGWGVALKARDGATRASEAAIVAVLAEALALSERERAGLAPWLRRPVRDRHKRDVGEIRAATPILA